jgi:hypothetical protein
MPSPIGLGLLFVLVYTSALTPFILISFWENLSSHLVIVVLRPKVTYYRKHFLKMNSDEMSFSQ